MPIGRSYGPDGAGAPPERRPSDDGQGRAEARDGADIGPRRRALRVPLVVRPSSSSAGEVEVGDPTSTASVADTARGTGAPRPAARRPGAAGPRRRQRQTEPRPHRLTLRLSDEELYLVSVAAAVERLTPTGYVGKVAVNVAAGRVQPAPTGLVDALGELLEARQQVRKFSVLVNQAVTKLHAIGELPAELGPAVALVGRVLPRLEDAAVAVRRASERGKGGGVR